MTPEQKARVSIDALLVQAGWHVCGVSDANIHAAVGVAIREFPLNNGFGFADYLLYVNGKACGVIEAKKEGATLTGVEVQSGRYAQGLPATLPAWRRPMPFLWESTGVETHFTNGLDPEPRARGVFAFFRPELLVQWLAYIPANAEPNTAHEASGTFLARMRHMPQLVTQWGSGGAHYQLWPAQITAIQNLEKSLAANKPKALIQMATGSGKTFTSIGFIYRLIKFGGARRVLFLVDRGNLARQTKKEFDAYASPYNAYKFGEEYIVQHLQGNQLDTSARVVKGVQATGYEASQGFVVRAGSQAVADTAPSMAQHVRGFFDLRQELISNGVLAMQGALYQFTQDYTFSAPSTAAAVVLGRSANGRVEWKAADGRTLKEIQEAEAAQ